MQNLPVKLYGNSILKRKCSEVKEINRDIWKLIGIMTQTMYQNKGIGLAAPQLGILRRIIIADIGEGLVSLINPRIISRKGKNIMEEGCLSFPGIHLEIKRAQEIIVQGINNKGGKIQMISSGLLARVIQHEIDHLNGVLIIDQVPKKRLKPIRKQLEEIKNTKTK